MSEHRIYYSEKLIQAFERALRKEFSLPYLRLERRPAKDVGRFNVGITSGTRQFQAPDAEECQNVVEICGDVPTEAFWFALKANFDLWTRGQHVLEHISITLFQKIANGDLIRVFRAEWDSRAANDSSSIHAQPHWHLVMGTDELRPFFASPDVFLPPGAEHAEFTGDTPKNPDTRNADIDFGHFHFAMSPLWVSKSVSGSDADSCHRQSFHSDDEVAGWFQSLSKYIAGQLVYMIDKTGGQGLVQDFR